MPLTQLPAMLSNPLQRYAMYHPNTISEASMSQPIQSLDSISTATPSQYSLHQLRHQPQHPPSTTHLGPAAALAAPKVQQNSTAAKGSKPTSLTTVRKRISRACDQCNQLRTKCNGQNPCAHCIEFGLGCEYIRERKKRGKVSRKDLAAAQAAAQTMAQTASSEEAIVSPKSNGESSSPIGLLEQRRPVGRVGKMVKRAATHKSRRNSEPMSQLSIPEEPLQIQQHAGFDPMGDLSPHAPQLETHNIMNRDLSSNNPLHISPYGTIDTYDRQSMSAHILSSSPFGGPQGSLSTYHALPYGLQTPDSTQYPTSAFHIRTNSLPGYVSPGNTSPAWMPMESPPTQHQFQAAHMQPPPAPPLHQIFHQQQPQQPAHLQPQPQLQSQPQSQSQSQSQQPQQSEQPPRHQQNTLRYPVLTPLLPHINGVMPQSLACDLVDLYFASSSSTMMHPTSPYVLGHVFRKSSFLHPTKPRQCQPALLASMLWVAAQTSDAQLLTSSAAARSNICQKLLELTISLLKPKVYSPSSTSVGGSSIDSVAATLGSLGVAVPGSTGIDALTRDLSIFGAARTLDDVVTYMHLATMVSASEYKGASLRWWTGAWSLALELKLCRELPSYGHMSCTEMAADVDIEAGADCNANTSCQEDVGLRASYTEEEREERRRVWWLAYTVDRHLALCYNRPLFLLDRECEGLLRPMDDIAWQQGNFTRPLSTETPGGAGMDGQLESEAHSPTHNPLPRSQHGPSYECTSHSIFGYFLPLMTILGEIVELHQAQNHTRFGPAFRASQECAKQISSVVHHLEIYEHSLARFEQRHTSAERSDQHSDAPTPSLSVHSAHSGSSVPTRMSESEIQTHIVTAYGTHVMHVLHILLADKWDPIDLLDNASQWMSSPAFSSATSHAIAAAEAISRILDYDPGLEFMPFFFGIYLLQGSFLLLLIASKVPQGDGAAPVARACETIIRAHEACVVTLNTEYQRNFSKVMRSTLAQIRGRAVADLQDAQQRRRELLSLYRWTGDGMGLAL